MKLLLSPIVLALLTTFSLSAGPAMATPGIIILPNDGGPPPPPPTATVEGAPGDISEQQPPTTVPGSGLLQALPSGEKLENPLSAGQRAQALQRYLLGTLTDVGFPPTEEEVLAALEQFLPPPDAGPIMTTAYAVSAELLVERAVLLLPAAAANIVSRVVQSYPKRAAAIVTTAITSAPDQKGAIVDAAKLAAPGEAAAIEKAAEAARAEPITAPATAVPQRPTDIKIDRLVTEYPDTKLRDDRPGPPISLPQPTSPFVP